MTSKTWLAYNDLAWTDAILATPNDYAEDTELYCQILKEHSQIEIRNLLHLGCGAGGNDFTFKKHFKVTGVDISPGMLEIARNLNPEMTYHPGDMRNVNLAEKFEAVVIPDSIDYMTTETELEKAIFTANNHLKPGGVMLLVAHIQEEFQENNFAYTGSRGEIEITVFENNYINRPDCLSYEAAFIYLIRRAGKLEVHTECHTLGLFPQSTWFKLIKQAGLELRQMRLDHTYDRFLLNDGEYRQQFFICRKPL